MTSYTQLVMLDISLYNTHIKVKNGRMLAILNLIEGASLMVQLSGTVFQILHIHIKVVRKPHILFYSDGLAVWHGFPDVIRNTQDTYF